MKKNNPHTPIMIREALNVEPKVYARYGPSASPPPRYARPDQLPRTNPSDPETNTLHPTEFGKEKMESLKGLDDKAIENKVTELVKSGI
ncbi:hypothetical protein LTR66_009888 [Elasticomyces elasticus]|nr:hypothetical protein LTR28_000576 [Elasticomyces elasticus]KAK4981560.1 hypothetical protein LTR66_009888 [Elasticomyces elasticus]KAK4990223.1 hypothetical protein LTR50_002697 [Elasticomyces elasticus]